MNESELRTEIAAERGALAALLGALEPADWDRPSLCEGWRVREVAAHITTSYRSSGARFLWELAKGGGRMNRVLDKMARRDAAAIPAADLHAALRDNTTHPWKPPGGGYAGALTHDVVHGLDITVALGLERRVPQERLRVVLEGMATPRGVRYFGADLDGVRLAADDMDWSYGSGTPVTGAAQDLLMVLAGRRLPAGHLAGEHSARFAAAAG
ncbi:maleylpyruvate isomerase family mycothiol-dependent enzyme [Spirillospora sp. NPDC047279]|uniref:maleylpyruvate isomerase family mycothiol-dependent enzyme n=1 Tax=Spirillospora sp. NPDC047279 TaxID=3155478 RepID=UPI0033CFBDA6